MATQPDREITVNEFMRINKAYAVHKFECWYVDPDTFIIVARALGYPLQPHTKRMKLNLVTLVRRDLNTIFPCAGEGLAGNIP